MVLMARITDREFISCRGRRRGRKMRGRSGDEDLRADGTDGDNKGFEGQVSCQDTVHGYKDT